MNCLKGYEMNLPLIQIADWHSLLNGGVIGACD